MMDGFASSAISGGAHLVAIAEYASLRFVAFDEGTIRSYCYGLEVVSEILIDENRVETRLWTFDPRTSFIQVDISAELLDGQEHSVEVIGLHAGRRARLTTHLRSDYVSSLSMACPGHISGWIYDAAFLTRSIVLIAEFDDRREIAVVAGQIRSELDGPAGRSVFTIDWPIDPHRSVADVVTVRVDGTGLYPFGRLRLPQTPIDRKDAGGRAVTTLASGPFYRRIGAPRVAILVVIQTATALARHGLRSLQAASNRIASESL